MKLKKIASLAAAGMMAVSMLTACQNTSVKPEDPTDPIQPGTDGVSAAVETRVAANLDAVGSEIPEYVTFADDNDLDNALEYAVEYAGVQQILPGYVELESLSNWSQWPGTQQKVYTVLQDEVGDDEFAVTVWNIGSVDTLQDAETVNSYEIEDDVAVELYAISSAIGENAVNQLVANQIDRTVESYEYSTRNLNGSNDKFSGGNYNHEYTVSVSTYTKTVNSSIEGGFLGNVGHIDGAADPSVTFVAIQVVRTATHQ